MLRYDKSRLEARKASEYFTLREKQNTRRVAEKKNAVILGRGILLPYLLLLPVSIRVSEGDEGRANKGKIPRKQEVLSLVVSIARGDTYLVDRLGGG